MDMQIELADALIQGSSTKAIEILNSLLNEGKEVRKIVLNLIEFFRDVLMKRNVRKLDENNLLYKNEQFMEISNKISNRQVFYILDVLNKVFNDIKWSNNPKIYLELGFIKITDEEVGSESKLISIIDDLENRVLEIEKIKSGFDALNKRQSENKIKEIIQEEETQEEVDLLEDIEVEETVEEVEKDDQIIVNDDEIIEQKLCDDLDNTYSISFVENVMNNGNREDKNKLNDEWVQLRRSAKTEDEKFLSKILETGKVVASSIENIIITFPSGAICNQLMTPTNKEIAQQLISNHFERDMDYIALPEDVFSDLAKEFIELWSQGKRNIKLTKISCEELKDVSKESSEDNNNHQPKVVSDAIDLFGDAVKVKK
jgi:DNA polymerase III subunit gamma/tau